MTKSVFSQLLIPSLPEVARIHAACFDDAWNENLLRRILAMPGAFGLSARYGGLGGNLAGFALARIAADECELLSLAVAPEHRREGLGAMLLDAAMVEAAAMNVRKFFLEVAEDNDAALTLYASRGMVAVGRRPDYYELSDGGFSSALTMRCDLALTASYGE